MSTKWYHRQLRILQTVMREKDLKDYDAKKVVAYMLETNTNCIVVNAGGVVDFLPDITDFGRKNRFMGEQDFLRELVTECHKNDIRIIVRVDFRGVEKERFEQHPDWFGQDPDGNGLTGWNDLIHRPCYNSYYGNEHAKQYIDTLLSRYDVDGVWENCVIFGYGACYCPKCRAAYRHYSGQEIPTGEDYFSDEFAQYRQWKAGIARGHLANMRAAVKAHGDDKAYVSEIFDMYHVKTSINSGIDLYDAKEYFDFLVSPLFLDGSAIPDKKYEDLYNVSTAVKFLKSISDGKQCVVLTGNNGTKWRYVRAPKQESRIWMWEAVASGGDLWNNYFNGQSPASAVDRRNSMIQADIYQYMKKNEELLTGQKPYAEVGIYYSRSSRDHFGNDSMQKDQYGSAIKGVERVLTENHVPFCFVPDIELSTELLRGLKALILPNAACLSDQEMETIREYVKSGGGLVATYQTSLYDEKGKRRIDFGLKELFGCSYTGIMKDTHFDSYQLVSQLHPILDHMDIENTEMILNDETTLLCTKTDASFDTVCTYVPMIYNQPPEYAWISEEKTSYPTIITGAYGAGRIVYFSNQIDRACYMHGHEDLVQSLYNAIVYVSGDRFLITTDAPGSVHLSVVTKKSNEYIVSLVNATSAGLRPAREIVPVHNVHIVLHDCRISEMQLLHGDCVSAEQQAGKDTILTVPVLEEFTSVFISLEK